jgi:capsular polysaccharide export protein
MTDAAALIYGVKWWNKPQVAAMAGGNVRFTNDADALLTAIDKRQTAMTWASREPEGAAGLARSRGATLVRIEDGFIRSPGLGAHFSPAFSLIFDDVGVYYDATRPSRLEILLAETEFNDALLARAAAVRRRLVELAVSKYAVGRGGDRLSSPEGRDKILVVGQVEDDASIRLGGAEVRTNIELLREARAAHPYAWIAYKPHPDVMRAGRPGFVSRKAALEHVDAYWPKAPIDATLDWADTVHTISSLAGFEALLRQKAVHVHGRPFYAGWGLTKDYAEAPIRRGRELPLDALIAATLLLYPRYLDPYTQKPCEAEALLDRFAEGWRDPLRGRPLWHRTAAAVKRTLGPLRGRL